MYPTAQNIVLGAGHVYFDPFDSDGNPTGEEYLGDTPGLSLSVGNEKVSVSSSDGEVAEPLLNVFTSVTRDFKVTCRNMNDANWGRFLQADPATVATTSGSVTGGAVNGGRGVVQGRWYPLGVDSDHPTGVRNLTGVAIKDATPTTYDLTDDYLLDAAGGRIYIVPGGAIADDTVLLADYTKPATSWTQLRTRESGPARGALRYIAKNSAGANRDLFIPVCTLAGEGDVNLKSRTDVQQIVFAVAVEKPIDGRASVYLDGSPA